MNRPPDQHLDLGRVGEEIQATRLRLRSTLDELSQQLSPPHVLGRVLGWRHSGTGDSTGVVKQIVRERPFFAVATVASVISLTVVSIRAIRSLGAITRAGLLLASVASIGVGTALSRKRVSQRSGRIVRH